MKRDLSLIRDLLLAIEEADKPPSSVELCYEKNEPDTEVAIYHLRLMQDAGLVTCLSSNPLSGDWYCEDLKMTWEGHDYIDAVRDPEVWKRTKTGAGAVGGMALGAVKDMATAYAKHIAKEKLGLEF